MKQLKLFILALILLSLSAGSIAAVNPEQILGLWNTEDKKAKVEIYKCADKYCGKIVWLKDPNYEPGSKEGVPGTPKIDFRNSDPSLRTRPIVGMPFMTGFVFDGDRTWTGGRLYDPEKGKTYSGKITLVSPEQLDLRGYIGISLIGRTSTWTR